MSRYDLEHLADDSLLDGLHSLVEKDRQATADLLAHIGEVARRRLFFPMGHHSMQAYCVRVLHLSESAASKRVQVARKGWVLPVIFEAIAEGRVHLSGMNLLVPFIDEENVHELIAAAAHRTCREIELLLAECFPKPTPEEGVEDLNVKDVNAAPHLRTCSGVKPIAPQQYLVQFGLNEQQQERLQYARQLMSHRNPTGNLTVLHMTAVELLIERLEKEIFAATDSPRAGAGSSSSRHIPANVARAVWARDGGQCTYLSSSGRRCESKWKIEFHHIVDFARGGKSTIDNLRLLCHGHNQYAAECTYGREFMDEKRAASGPREAQGWRTHPNQASSYSPARGADAGG
jgi:5-methylcytosine-specific restriction endonuclease McrA